MVGCMLEHNKKIKILINEKGNLQAHLVTLEEQIGLKRPSLSSMTSRLKSFRSARIHYGTTNDTSIDN